MSAVGADADLLARIEEHFDASPRSAADVEEHGALTLFVSRIPWRFYGRPRLGLAHDVGADDVAAVRARQRELGVREAFEWVHETTPSLAGAAVAAGLQVAAGAAAGARARRTGRAPPDPGGVAVRMLERRRPRRCRRRRPSSSSRSRQTAPRSATPARRRATWPPRELGDLGFMRERIRTGLTAMAVAESEADGPLGAGSHQLVGAAAEVTGVGTLPSARRRGIGAAVTGRLVQDARERGAEVVYLSAAGDDVARLYERLGFRRIGTACFGFPGG